MANQGSAWRLRAHDLFRSPYPARTTAEAGFLEIEFQDEGKVRMRRRRAAGPPAQHVGALIDGGARKAGMPCSGVLRLLGRQLELVGHWAEFGKRTGFHLPHRPAAMHLHRGFGDAAGKC
jgi:hypothetical protein